MTPEVEMHHEPHHESHRTGHRWVDWSVTGCALFVSFCSLAISIHHGHTMELLVQANSLPFLQFEYFNVQQLQDASFKSELLLDVANVGAGPARVEWFRATFGGKPVTDWQTTIEALQQQAIASGKLPAAVPLGSIVKSDFGAAFIKGGDNRHVLRWQRTEANATFWEIAERRLRNFNDLKLQVCYCSIFDQCWLTSNRSFKPQSVESCSNED